MTLFQTNFSHNKLWVSLAKRDHWAILVIKLSAYYLKQIATDLDYKYLWKKYQSWI